MLTTRSKAANSRRGAIVNRRVDNDLPILNSLVEISTLPLVY